MVPTLIESLLPPTIAVCASLVTLYFTQRRADRTEQRMASKDIVEMLLQQNEALLEETRDLRTRITSLEASHSRCQEEVMDLMRTIARLRNDEPTTA